MLPVARSVAVDEPVEKVFPTEPFVAVGQGALLNPAMVEAANGKLHPDPDQSAAPYVARIGSLRAQSALPPHEVALAYLREADAKKPELTVG